MGVLKAKVGDTWVPIGQGLIASAPGYVGRAYMTADQVIAGTAAVDVTGLAVTFTADPTHIYKTTVVITVSKSTAVGNINVQIADAANSNITTQVVQASTTTDILAPFVMAVESGLSGTQTRKVRASTNVAGLTINGSATYKTMILVEDITTAYPGGLKTAWIPFTPVMRGNGVANTVGTGGSSGNTQGRYKVIDTVCHFQLIWTFGATGAVAQSGIQTFDLPVQTTAPWASSCGSGAIVQGTTLYQVQAIIYDNTKVKMWVPPNGDVTNSYPSGITFGNSYAISGMYQVA